MAKFHKSKDGFLVFHCPGCNIPHIIDTRWTFNGDFDKPRIVPSLLVRYPYNNENRICHSYIIDGMIEYLSDCTHALAGKKIELPDFETLHPDWSAV
jgi:hypothetical protein